MNFRRQPFQFTAIDPAKRQAELQKRFGLPSTSGDMYVDFLNPGMMNSGIKTQPFVNGSPRLQHRVPIFTESADKANLEQKNVDGGHKPRVRVVPIQVEGVDGGNRHRTVSGPAGMVGGSTSSSTGKLQETFLHHDANHLDEKPKQPRVCNIPIRIEAREEKPKVDEMPEVETTSKIPEPAKKLKTEQNGCAASKSNQEKPDRTVPLNQIEKVLDKLKEYQEEVEKFSGTFKDKQYRYLDEMLTRCMLDLDNVDTRGIDEIRKARKEAVKQVQHYVDLLDAKVNAGVEMMDSATTSTGNPAANSKNGEMVCDILAEADSTVGPNSSDLTTSNNVNVCVSEDVEMSDEATNEAVSFYTKNIGESVGMNEGNLTGNVEMAGEKALSSQMSDITREKTEVSTQEGDGEPMDSAVIEDSDSQIQGGNENKTPVPEGEMESASCLEQDSELKESENGSKIVIEELDESLVNRSNVGNSESSEHKNVLDIIMPSSLDLGVKEGIAQECSSKIAIEETEDDYLTENNGAGKDIERSINSCDSCVDKVDSYDKLTVDQLNIKSNSYDVSNT